MAFTITCPSSGNLFNSVVSNNIATLPLDFFLDGNFYKYNGQPLPDEVISKILGDCLPDIAPVSIKQYANFFSSVLSRSSDILHIEFSSYYSDNYKNAQAAWRSLQPEFSQRKMRIIDSKRLALGVCALVFEANKLLESGASLQDAAAAVKKLRDNNIDLVVAGDLTYLKRKGFITFFNKKLGLLKNTCPILSFDKEGRMTPILKPSTFAKAQEEAFKIIKANCGSGCPEFFISYLKEIDISQFTDTPVLKTHPDILTMSKVGANVFEILCFKSS